MFGDSEKRMKMRGDERSGRQATETFKRWQKIGRKGRHTCCLISDSVYFARREIFTCLVSFTTFCDCSKNTDSNNSFENKRRAQRLPNNQNPNLKKRAGTGSKQTRKARDRLKKGQKKLYLHGEKIESTGGIDWEWGFSWAKQHCWCLSNGENWG